MMQITSILNRSTSATGPAVTGIMSCKFKGVVVYVSVPTVKLKFVPIITWRRKKPFSGSMHNLWKHYILVLTITVDFRPAPWCLWRRGTDNLQGTSTWLSPSVSLTYIVYTNLPFQNQHWWYCKVLHQPVLVSHSEITSGLLHPKHNTEHNVIITSSSVH